MFADDAYRGNDARNLIPVLTLFLFAVAGKFRIEAVFGERHEIEAVFLDYRRQFRRIRFVECPQNILYLAFHRGNGIQFRKEKFVFLLLLEQHFVLGVDLARTDDDGVQFGEVVNQKSAKRENRQNQKRQEFPRECVEFERNGFSRIRRNYLDDVVTVFQIILRFFLGFGSNLRGNSNR